MKLVNTAISGCVDISESLGIICYNRWFLSDGHKMTSRIGVSWTPAYLSVFDLFLTQWIMVILSKEYNPDNFELHNSLKLSFANIWGLRLNFVDCKSFLESNSPEILALCGLTLDNSTDSSNFSVRGYLPLIRTDSATHIHGLVVFVKERLPFALKLPLETCRFLLIFLTVFTQCLTSFSSIDLLLCVYAQLFILFHLK